MIIFQPTIWGSQDILARYQKNPTWPLLSYQIFQPKLYKGNPIWLDLFWNQRGFPSQSPPPFWWQIGRVFGGTRLSDGLGPWTPKNGAEGGECPEKLRNMVMLQQKTTHPIKGTILLAKPYELSVKKSDAWTSMNFWCIRISGRGRYCKAGSFHEDSVLPSSTGWKIGLER